MLANENLLFSGLIANASIFFYLAVGLVTVIARGVMVTVVPLVPVVDLVRNLDPLQ